MNGEEVIKAIEVETARVVKTVEAGLAEANADTYAYNRGYLDGLEYAISDIRALD